MNCISQLDSKTLQFFKDLILKCKFCGLETEYFEYENHLEKCDLRLVTCQFCHHNFNNKEMEMHLQECGDVEEVYN